MLIFPFFRSFFHVHFPIYNFLLSQYRFLLLFSLLTLCGFVGRGCLLVSLYPGAVMHYGRPPLSLQAVGGGRAWPLAHRRHAWSRHAWQLCRFGCGSLPILLGACPWGLLGPFIALHVVGVSLLFAGCCFRVPQIYHTIPSLVIWHLDRYNWPLI